MLGHDARRTGATADEIRPPFERKWYRFFTDEGLMSGIQPVIGDGTVFIGTMRGVLHALDAETGKDVWSFQAGQAILHTCAVAEGRVFLGSADSFVYALNTRDDSLAWKVKTDAAVWNAPVIQDGTVCVGSRDGKLYAIEAANGRVKWIGPTTGPLLNSAAVDPQSQRVYIGSEDMHVYAFDTRTGKQLWRSPKLPGVSLRGYHPVVAPDGSVMVTTAPALSLDTIQQVLLDMVKVVFGDFASWRHSKEENALLREANFKLMEKPETYSAQLDYLRRRLTDEPAYQTFFVLDPATGKPKFIAPIVYAESMNGPGAPAIVTADGKVIVKFQALLRSRYEHYSPFLNVGYLDTTNGHITPIMDQSRTYGWHDSLLLVHDEQCQLAAAGRVLINTHQDSVNALDLGTLKGYGEPFCQNIHEPAKGEALGIWTCVLRDQPLPNGKEWLARGTAVYGGGSVLDVSIAVASDSFYYLPTHEINAGVALIAYRMKPGGAAAKRSPLPADKFTDGEWRKVQETPWDWDTLEISRLKHVPEALPGVVPGTRRNPLTNEAARTVAAINDEALDRIIWEARTSTAETSASTGSLASVRAQLVQAVRERVSRTWRPLLFPSGKHPEEAYRFFNEPSETLYTLALAYPYLDQSLREEVSRYVSQLGAPDGPLSGATGQKTYSPSAGEVRSAYNHPPEKLMKIRDGILRSELGRLYPLWLWAHMADDWSHVEKSWAALRERVRLPPNKFEEDCGNAHLAGLIAYCRMAWRMKDHQAEKQGASAARQALRERLTFELAHTRGGLIWPLPVGRSAFSRWHFLTPEVGRLLAQQARPIHQHLMAVYVDHHRPAWWLAWNIETLMRNESPYELPTTAADIFAARSLILGENADELASFLDLPWCRADEFYIQRLALTLAAHGTSEWRDVRHNN